VRVASRVKQGMELRLGEGVARVDFPMLCAQKYAMQLICPLFALDFPPSPHHLPCLSTEALQNKK